MSACDIDAVREDAYWQGVFRSADYYRAGFDYEDYAPAYYNNNTNNTQYGGEWDDAENSLWANWERIKGDSRLTYEYAGLAMRAAWERMSQPVAA